MKDSAAQARLLTDESNADYASGRFGPKPPGLAIAANPNVDPAAKKTSSSSGPLWEPVAASKASRVPTSSEVLQKTRNPGTLPSAVEAQLTHTLTRPPAPDESHHACAANRERELMTLIAGLDVTQAFHLGRRLEVDRSDDAIAVAFRRLTVERRQRIRSFIADARRRVALKGA